jgi:hypothetical protein
MENAADDVGVIRRHHALRRYYQDWIDTLADLRAEVEEILFEADDRVAVAVRNSGRGRASGAAAEGATTSPTLSERVASSPAASTPLENKRSKASAC